MNSSMILLCQMPAVPVTVEYLFHQHPRRSLYLKMREFYSTFEFDANEYCIYMHCK